MGTALGEVLSREQRFEEVGCGTQDNPMRLECKAVYRQLDVAEAAVTPQLDEAIAQDVWHIACRRRKDAPLGGGGRLSRPLARGHAMLTPLHNFVY